MTKINKNNIEDILPLTPMQEGMLYHYLKDPESDYYFEQLSMETAGEIDKKNFEKAWHFVIETNQMLRAVFRWEKVENPIQIILKEHPLPWKFYDFSDKNANERKKCLEEVKAKDRKEKFNLQDVPFRVTLCKVEEKKYLLMISSHHILYDGWSNGIILKEFFQAYNHLISGKPLIKPVKTKFKEFVKWIHQRDRQVEKQFWNNYLKDFDSPTELSIKKREKLKEPTAMGSLGSYRFRLPGGMKKKLKDFSLRHKITLASLIYSTWGLLLQKYNNSDDVIFGTTVSGRNLKIKGIEEIVGLFINTLPLRVQTHGNERLIDLIHHVNNALTMREAYGTIPLADIEKFFDTIVIIENYPLDIRLKEMNEHGNFYFHSYRMFEVTHYDLLISLSNLQDIEVQLDYNKEVLDDDAILRLSHHFKGILKTITDAPDKKLVEVDIISEKERKKILFDFNETGSEADYPTGKTMHELFEEQVKKTPGHKALVGQEEGWKARKTEGKKEGTPFGQINTCGEMQLTYKELNEKSDQLAHVLRQKGVRPGILVGIMMERSIEMVIGIFGILKAGGAYLPIDIEYPDDRINYMLKDSRASVILTNSSRGRKSEIRNPKSETNPNDPNSNDQNKRAGVMVLDFEHLNFEFVSNFEFRASNFQVGPANLAYVIYTSGSTGKSKGVMVEHRAIVNTLVWRKAYYRFNRSDVVLQLPSISFDSSVEDIFTPLISGSQLVLIEDQRRFDMNYLKVLLKKVGITHFLTVPALYRTYLEEIPDSLKRMKNVTIAGEHFTGELVKQHFKKLSHVKLYNEYGPTENSVCSTVYEFRTGKTEVLIGTPIQNVFCYILQKKGELCPIGIGGELYLAGAGIARGYLNRPELTAEKFKIVNDKLKIKNRSNKKVPGKVHKDHMQPCRHVTMQLSPHHSPQYPITPSPHHPIYKTGDLARWLPDGNIEFMGRCDLQVKIRGFRVELKEIENCLTNHEDIKQAVVLSEKDEKKENYLIAFIISQRTFSIEELRQYLSKELPEYMIPAHFVQLEKLPLSPNGKVDIKALRASGKILGTGVEYMAPRDNIEKVIAAIWKELLKLDKVGIHENFFDIGGNSFSIIRLRSRLKKTFKENISIVTLFNHPTIASLAGYLGGEEKEKRLSAPKMEKGSEMLRGRQVAIIGMSGRFPGAKNIIEFWDNLKNGRESITFFADEELAALGVDSAHINNDNYVKAKGVLEDMEHFDSPFFDYSVKESELMDPQIRILHECVFEALEDAGYDSSSYNDGIGLYLGSMSNDWRMQRLYHQITTHSDLLAVGSVNNRDYLATRISYKLNLKGPALTVQTACSTSLVAVDTAYQALLSGKCRITVAGGISMTFEDRGGYLYEEGMVRSPDGHCRPFDARAKGTIGGNGVGVVVLKPLTRALEDGDNIRAVIKGSATNNDGARKVGYTAPSVEGQVEVIRAALQAAGVDCESITYVETHGTGTVLGDPVEIEALTQTFKTGKKGFCALGAVKANIGHLDAAAGMAGLIKTILALEHHVIPPAVNFETSNPQIDFKGTPFYINTRLMEWRANGFPRRAGVSSFGIGGTNAHVVLEEAPVIDHPSSATGKGRDYRLMVLSAKTRSALDKMATNLGEYFKKNPGINLADAAYTLQVGRKAFDHRRIMVCSDINEAFAGLSKSDPEKVFSYSAEESDRRVVFMFPGQGAQYADMGLGLYQSEVVFREQMDRCFKILNDLVDYDIKEVLYPGEMQDRSNRSNKSYKSYKSHINQTEIAQPVLFIFEYALAKLLMKWGIEPYAMIGHSIGEYVAACLSGVFSLEDALKLVVLRGELMQRIPGGTMLSIPLSEERLIPLLNKNLSLAAVNSSSYCVVSGSYQSIAEFEQKLKCMGIDSTRLHTSHAFHSSMMEPVLRDFEKKLQQVELRQPKRPYISNITGDWITMGDTTNPGYWSGHIRRTVRFSTGLEKLLKEEGTIFVEIGPGKSLGAFVEQHENKRDDHLIINLVKHPKEEVCDHYYLLNRIGQLWLYGTTINWNEFYPGEPRRRIPLPTYPFERKPYRVERVPAVSTNPAVLEKKPDIADWFSVPLWEQCPPIFNQSPEIPDSTNWLVFVDEVGAASRLVSRLQQNRQNVITVSTGAGFAKSKDGMYVMNPSQSSHYDTLFKELRRLNQIPQKILHFWGVTGSNGMDLSFESLDRAQDLGLYSLLNIVQTIGRQDISSDIQMIVVTDNLHEVTGEEHICPAKASVLGAVKIIPLEYKTINCRNVDIVLPQGGGVQQEEFYTLLFKEFLSDSSEKIAAWRGKHRWIQRLKPHRMEPTPPEKKRNWIQSMKEKGVYLIIGGLGGMGFTLAQHLAGKLKAKLVLVGRSGFPSRDQWNRWLAAHDEDNKISIKIRKIMELEEHGAEVAIFSADVSDYEKMQYVISQSMQRFGKINGVIHAAGVIDYAGVIQRRTREMTELAMAAKVKGTLVLERILKDAAPDIFILFSSIGNYLYGVKFGQVGYNAANEFLDAFVHYNNSQNGTFTASINWCDWKKVGMSVNAVNSFKERFNRNLDNFTYDSFLFGALSPGEGVEAFERIMESCLPRVVVSVLDLETQMRKQNHREKEELSYPGGVGEADDYVAHQRPALSTRYVAPGNEFEQELVSIFKGFLRIEKMGIYDNFFELGVTSLDIVRLNDKIKKIFKQEISTEKFFTFPNIHSLSKYMGQMEPTGIDHHDDGMDRQDTLKKGKNRLKRRKISLKESV